MNERKPDVKTFVELVRADIRSAREANALDAVAALGGIYDVTKRSLEATIAESDSALRGRMWLSVVQVWRETRSPMVLRAVGDVISTVTEGYSDAALTACLNVHELRAMIADVLKWESEFGAGSDFDAWLRRIEDQIHHLDFTLPSGRR